MKTKIFALLGAIVAVCSFTSCDVYAPGYAYGGYNRPYYGSSLYSPFYSPFRSGLASSYYRSYPSYRYRSNYVPVSSWNNWNRNWNHRDHDHDRNRWDRRDNDRDNRSWSRSSSSWQRSNQNRSSSFNLGNLGSRTTASFRYPGTRSSSSTSWNRSGNRSGDRDGNRSRDRDDDNRSRFGRR
jgi:hypothetical protein